MRRSGDRARCSPSSPTTAELASLRLELDGLADAIDGLSDALTAETAYQMARGNTARTAATLAAIAQGDAPPPELEVARIAAQRHRRSRIACCCC